MTSDRTPRVALITNLCPHYRRPLYELLAERFQLDCYFFATTESYWNPLLPAFEAGDYPEVRLRRVEFLGEPLLPGLARRLTRHRYDAVIMDLTGRLMVPYVFGVTRLRRLPFVIWTGLWDHPRTAFHRLTRPVVESIYRRADAVLVYGDHVRRALLAVDGVDNTKIFTAWQAVDGSRFAVGADVAASRELLFVGQFEVRKGVDDLLSAFSLVSDPAARLSLVGNGSLDDHVRRRAGLDPRITVVGHVPQRDLPDHYARARCLVLPSITTPDFREPWGLVVNEAMHCGLPVIASNAVGAAAGGLVEDGVTGLVVSERDQRALGGAMTRILADDASAIAMAARAQARVSSFTFDAMADAFEAAVDYAMDRSPRVRAMTSHV